MRVAAMVIGILGAVITFIIAILFVLLGGLGDALGIGGSGGVVIMGWLTLIASIVALVGAILSKNTPMAGAIMMAVSAIPGIILIIQAGIPILFILGSLLLIVGAVLAFVANSQAESA